MNTMTKMTYRNALEIAINSVNDVEVKEKLTALSESLAKKSKGGERKPTKTQKENETLKIAIVNGMEENRIYRIAELLKEIPELNELTSQRVSALVKQLKDEGKVVRTEEKGKAFFSLA